MWIPTWLGEIYAKLYAKFWEELFTFEEAKSHLSITENKLAVAFSKLHTCRVLLVFNPGRPRLYRLVNPQCFLLLASDLPRNLSRIVQERYVTLICEAFLEVYKVFDLTSMAVYGSVARGKAGEDSDVDVLVVSNDFGGSMGSRVEELYKKVGGGVKDELGWLRRHSIHTNLSFYPLREEEAERAPILFLDLTEEAVILHDRDRFLERVLTEFKARLLRLGARRIATGKHSWYWDLKPEYKFGEEIEI